MLTIFS
ncbi:dsDNA-mimic protein, partial [Haemophilus influenzae]